MMKLKLLASTRSEVSPAECEGSCGLDAPVQLYSYIYSYSFRSHSSTLFCVACRKNRNRDAYMLSELRDVSAMTVIGPVCAFSSDTLCLRLVRVGASR